MDLDPDEATVRSQKQASMDKGTSTVEQGFEKAKEKQQPQASDRRMGQGQPGVYSISERPSF